jgi:hypothetical protein
MKKYLNKKYITILSIILLAFILLGNYFTCPQYLNPIGLDSFNASLGLYERAKLNSTIIHYSNPLLGETEFGLIAYIREPILTPQDIDKIDVVIKKISERTYSPLIKGFAVTIERVSLSTYRNEAEIKLFTALFYVHSSPNLLHQCFIIDCPYDYIPKTLYARIDYTVYVIINPYAEIWYSNYNYIITGFYMRIYSGSITIPINL